MNKGYTLIELLIAVAIIAILTTMVLPNFYRTRIATRKTICMNNLRQIEAAVDRWVFENDVNEGSAIAAANEEEIYSYIRGGEPGCLAGGDYIIASVGTYPQVTCTISGHTLIEEE